MKKLLFVAFALAGMAVEAAYKDPNPYGNYGPAMAPSKGDAMAIEWHRTDRAAIDKATAPEALESILEDEDSVKALLARVKPAYGSDALDLVRIAAISQYVMEGERVYWWEFWRDDRSGERELWAKSLLDRAASAKDEYVTLFCLDQLRWCGLGCQAQCLEKLAAMSDSKAVKEMALIVIDQITGKSVN
jgi:hypothetical protein